MTEPTQGPDPWKSFRGVMAGTLILEAIVVLLALPVVGQVGGWAFLNSFPQYTPSDDLSIVTALSQFSTPGNALAP